MRTPRIFRSSAALRLGAVSFLWLGCDGEDVTAPTTGEITLRISTTGSSPDLDGYTMTLDGQAPLAVASNATLTLTVEEGEHTLELGGLESNCGVAGGTRRDVRVAAGEATAVTFDVVCGATTGGVRVVTTTSGGQPDPDGYSMTIDGGESQGIGANATVELTDIVPGDHTIQLLDVAPNCSVTADNPRVVTVPAGDFVETMFAVACTAGVQQWTPMASGTSADFSDLWGSSATDVFVVGESVNEEEFELASEIRHFDGVAWTQQLREVDLELRGVWGSAPADAYAVGFDFFSPDAKVLHFDGTRWSEVPGFTAGEFETLGFESVWGSSASDVFAVGFASDGLFNESLIFHFDGSSWRRIPVTGAVRPELRDVWGSSATDVYAVGLSDDDEVSTGVILRYDGVVWAPVLEEEGLSPNSLWGSSAADIFVVGLRVGDDFQSFGTILHYDGTRWSPMSLPSIGVLNEVWGSSATDVFAVGEEGVVLHYDGTVWTASNPTTKSLLGVWGSSPGDVFAAGEEGTILHGTP
jgi:hypothetical protein